MSKLDKKTRKKIREIFKLEFIPNLKETYNNAILYNGLENDFVLC